MVRFRFELVPVKTKLPFGTSVGLDDTPETTRAVAGVSTSPIVNEIGPRAISSGVVWFGISEIEGTSFTGLKVTVNESDESSAPSFTVRVMTAVPDWLVAGRIVTVRLDAAPPSVIFDNGTR